MTKRKLQSYKDGQLSINIPIVYAENLGLTKGNFVEIKQKGRLLIIKQA